MWLSLRKMPSEPSLQNRKNFCTFFKKNKPEYIIICSIDFGTIHFIYLFFSNILSTFCGIKCCIILDPFLVIYIWLNYHIQHFNLFSLLNYQRRSHFYQSNTLINLSLWALSVWRTNKWRLILLKPLSRAHEPTLPPVLRPVYTRGRWRWLIPRRVNMLFRWRTSVPAHAQALGNSREPNPPTLMVTAESSSAPAGSRWHDSGLKPKNLDLE